MKLRTIDNKLTSLLSSPHLILEEEEELLLLKELKSIFRNVSEIGKFLRQTFLRLDEATSMEMRMKNLSFMLNALIALLAATKQKLNNEFEN